MAKSNARKERQYRGAGTEAVGEAQAQEAGAKFEWHYGRVIRMGHFEVRYFIEHIWKAAKSGSC